MEQHWQKFHMKPAAGLPSGSLLPHKTSGMSGMHPGSDETFKSGHMAGQEGGKEPVVAKDSNALTCCSILLRCSPVIGC